MEQLFEWRTRGKDQQNMKKKPSKVLKIVVAIHSVLLIAVMVFMVALFAVTSQIIYRCEDFDKYDDDKVTGDQTANASSREETPQEFEKSVSCLIESLNDGCEYFYGGKCYRAVVHADNDVSYQKGIDICNGWSMEPAEIAGQVELEKLLKYLVTLMHPGSIRAGVHIGMSYNPANGEVKFNNGSRASFVKWHPMYPKSENGGTNMALYGKRDPADTNQGMYNVPKKKLMGILCQKC